MTSRTLPPTRAVDLLTLVGRDGLIESAAPTFAALLGVERAALVGVSIFELTSELDRRYLEEGWSALGRDAASWTVEVRMAWRAAPPRRLVWELVLDEEAGVVLATVHERRRLETWDQARRRDLLLSTIVEKAPVVAWIADVHGRILEIVGRMPGQLDEGGVEVRGKHAGDLFQDAPEMVAAVQRGLAGVGSFERYHVGDATLDTWLVPLQPGSGDDALLCVSIDVTREERARQEVTWIREIVDHQRAAMASRTVVLPVWKGVLCVPLSGGPDSIEMEELLPRILDMVVAHRASYLVVDVTGLRSIDTGVAGYIWQVASATRLLGARMILTGAGPDIAQTLIAIGVDIPEELLIFQTLEHGLRHCIQGVARRDR